jgi:hypothetical protein
MIIFFFINFSVPKSIKNCHSVRKKKFKSNKLLRFSGENSSQESDGLNYFLESKICLEIVMIISLSFFYQSMCGRTLNLSLNFPFRLIDYEVHDNRIRQARHFYQ